MSRAIENYVCASEDRSHYDTCAWDLQGFRYPSLAPQVTYIEVINKTEIVDTVLEEKIKKMVDTVVSKIQTDMRDDLLTELNETIASELQIDEIYGGSATEGMKENITP